MANLNRPNGAQPVRSRTGETRLEPAIVLVGNSTAMGIGDLIRRGSDGGWVRCAANEVPGGIFQGCTLTDSDGRSVEANYLPASTAADILVLKDPEVEFVMQTDGTTAYLLTMEGINCQITDAAPSTSGHSNQVLDLSTINVAAIVSNVGVPIRVGLPEGYPSPINNIYGAGNYYTRVLCTFALHQNRGSVQSNAWVPGGGV